MNPITWAGSPWGGNANTTTGDCQAGGGNDEIILAAAETFSDDELNGLVVEITAGTGAGQKRMITDYAGGTDTATVDSNWGTNPDATSDYSIYPCPGVISGSTLYAVSYTHLTLPTN